MTDKIETLEELEEKYVGFNKLAKQVGSPALAAWIGRKKYGKEGMKDSKAEHKAEDKKMNESISNLINNISSGKELDAEQTFNAIMADKVGAALENMKVDVASYYFNGEKKNEVEEEVEDDASMICEMEEGDKMHQMYIMHNYYNGKHYDHGGRRFHIAAKSPEEAVELAKKHKDKIEAHLRTVKVQSGSRYRNLISKNDKFHLTDKSFHSAKESELKNGGHHYLDRSGEIKKDPYRG